MADETEVTQESLLALAADFDAGKNIDAGPDKGKPASEAAPAGSQPDVKAAEKKAATDKETVAKDGQQPSKDSKEKVADKPADEKVESKWAQNEKRRAKSWVEVNAEKDKLRLDREQLQRERDELNKTKATPEVLRDEGGASAKDYREAAKQLREKGENALADAAEKLAAQLDKKDTELKQQRVIEEGKQKWQKNFATMCDKHPALKDPASEMSKAALQVLNEFPMLKHDPDGLLYAVRAAELHLQYASFEGTKTELATLKAEHEKLQKKLTISGGSPTDAVPEQKPFEKMTLAEQRKHLERSVDDYDRDNGLN